MQRSDIEETTSLVNQEAKSKVLAQDISKTNARFYMLFLACLICFGSYFAYDAPTSIQSELEEVMHT